jgi:hypothetical protein
LQQQNAVIFSHISAFLSPKCPEGSFIVVKVTLAMTAAPAIVKSDARLPYWPLWKMFSTKMDSSTSTVTRETQAQ